MRLRRITEAVKGIAKSFKLYLVHLALALFSKVFETLAFSTLFYCVNEIALVLIIYPLLTSEVRTQMC